MTEDGTRELQRLRSQLLDAVRGLGRVAAAQRLRRRRPRSGRRGRRLLVPRAEQLSFATTSRPTSTSPGSACRPARSARCASRSSRAPTPAAPASRCELDTTDASVLEFTNNEAYGAMQTGLACGWSGTISNFTVWHASRHGVTGHADGEAGRRQADRARRLVGARQRRRESRRRLDRQLRVEERRRRATPTCRACASACPARSSTDQTAGARPREGSLTRREQLLPQLHRRQRGDRVRRRARAAAAASKKAVVRSSVFEPLNVQGAQAVPAGVDLDELRNEAGDPEAARSASWSTTTTSSRATTSRSTTRFRRRQTVAPCHDTLPGIGGWVCK